jgi:putative flippase GtrA
MTRQFKYIFNRTCSLIFSKQFRRFVFFGFICNALGLFSLYVLTDILKLYYVLSLLIALICVNFIGFYFNKYYTFKTSPKTFFQELGRYYLVMSSGFIINLVSMYTLVEIFKLWYIMAAVIISIVLLFYNFVLHKYWSFKKIANKR